MRRRRTNKIMEREIPHQATQEWRPTFLFNIPRKNAVVHLMKDVETDPDLPKERRSRLASP
ncbi:hypothetical protein DPMN_053300 [Dreissena polymorpha]|uniref:Uncharacterized protein n=1 Tax=Dreissena polymorpha TaxID=45954 RepID=A0A9D4CMC4_DREPO|nr:hypothetical protein DPMN_053300 [Dreissena polymorpha]